MLALIAVLVLATCQALPQFEYDGYLLSNNSLIFYHDIGYGYSALKCVTHNENCCTNNTAVTWTDDRGRLVQEGEDGISCTYVTREVGGISLNRRRDCNLPSSGLWRCDIPDSTGETQSLYIYFINGNIIKLYFHILDS